ncbi:hypothetical protein B9Z19DRAFT_1126525 [Tuber borchii]|uniref:Uncharacterized protein n=1 Tax=Tuber borchii TaxID=42251 RepID=A0A2T6ZT00_TUBBO|nr:hypothetical protein B9Z19DRAFT_1126525 [Tuber borchii]
MITIAFSTIYLNSQTPINLLPPERRDEYGRARSSDLHIWLVVENGGRHEGTISGPRVGNTTISDHCLNPFHQTSFGRLSYSLSALSSISRYSRRCLSFLKTYVPHLSTKGQKEHYQIKVLVISNAVPSSYETPCVIAEPPGTSLFPLRLTGEPKARTKADVQKAA